MADTDSIDTLGILARTIWGEARGDGKIGMQAVANVIKNRAENPSWWGTDIRSVCLKPWQFSCWNKNDPNRCKMLEVQEDSPSFRDAKAIASDALNNTLEDIVCGATYYYAKYIKTPKWAIEKKPCAEIGEQLFFNNIK